MKIIFKNHTGAVENKSVNLCEAFAVEVADSERVQALEQGFYSHTIGDKEIWRQARLTRINLEKFTHHYIPKYNYSLSKPTNIPRHNEIYDTYMDKRNYYKHNGDRDFATNDLVIDYMDKDNVVWGYSKIAYFDKDIVDLKLFCVMCNDYDITSKYTLNFELDYFQKNGFKYAYLGPSYQRSSIFKSKIHGFEWWTGEEWSTITREFHNRCMND